MEYFPVSKDDRGLVINGIPDAVRVVRIAGPKAKRLADLSLHKWDLEFALGCLEGINRVPDEPRVVRLALWRAAIIHYVKCFGDNVSRFQLAAGAIYKGKDLALENFAFFQSLRNKNIVHDENSYHQSIPGAVLNDGTKSYKVEKIICFAALGETLGQDNFNNLHLLITTALSWVTAQFDELCDLLTADLEAQPYDVLSAMDSLQYSKPRVEDVAKKRSSL